MKKILTFVAALMLFASLTGLAMAETCEYDTRWGVLTLTYDWDTNTVSGWYEYKNGEVYGTYYEDNTIRGTWHQPDGSGEFIFYMSQTGFSGYWKYTGDYDWQGEWNGNLRGCY